MGHVRVKLRIAHPEHPTHALELLGSVDPSEPVALVPAGLARRLNLPRLDPEAQDPSIDDWRSYAFIEHARRSSMGSVVVTSDVPEVIIGRSTLTVLCLEIDRRTGRLRKFEPMLL